MDREDVDATAWAQGERFSVKKQIIGPSDGVCKIIYSVENQLACDGCDELRPWPGCVVCVRG